MLIHDPGNGADLGAATSAALATGDFRGLFGAIDKIVNEVETSAEVAGATSGQLEVELDSLTALYQQLSDVHETLATQRNQVFQAALDGSHVRAGGTVSGTAAAYTALLKAVGLVDNGQGSFIDQVTALDMRVQGAMQSLLNNVQKYAAQEGFAVHEIGSAAVAAPPSPAPNTSAPGVSTTSTW